MARTQKGFQPMLAERKAPDLSKLVYPVLGSPKLDGIRCIIREGAAYSRKLKLIPNLYVQECLRGLLEGLDGELMVGTDTSDRAWNNTQSGVMSRDGEPSFKYCVFDRVLEGAGFEWRYRHALGIVQEFKEAYPWLEIVPHHYLNNIDDINHYEELYVSRGYEGLMLRSLDGPYKYGRATLKEGTLLKLKRFTDTEARCVGYVERMHNANEQERDERGYAKRSHAKAGKVGTDTLGALVFRLGVNHDGTYFVPPPGLAVGPYLFGKYEVVEFEVGTGYTAEERAALWARRDTDLINSVHTFKFQGITPDEHKPRFPVWKGERHEYDFTS